MRILIGGDVSPTFVNDKILNGEGEALFGNLPSLFKQADRVLLNFECAMTDHDGVIKKCGPNLKCSPRFAETLKNVGVTDCALSNNHIFDYGVQGALDTIQSLENVGINHTGFGKDYADARRDLIMEKDDKSVAIINVCEHEYCYALEDRMGARPFDPFDTIEDIRAAKASHDFVVVLYHGGKEQCVYPSPRLQKACRAMVNHGADVVLCQHSHCIGGYEAWNDGHILYGQGNFFFCGHPFDFVDDVWNSGLLVQLDIHDKLEIKFIPVESIIDENSIRVADGKIKEEILTRFDKNSNSLIDGSYKEGWKAFCKTKPYYRTTIEDADGKDMDVFGPEVSPNELFSHFLFCEAHQDVWRELFQLPWELRNPDA